MNTTRKLALFCHDCVLAGLLTTYSAWYIKSLSDGSTQLLQAHRNTTPKSLLKYGNYGSGIDNTCKNLNECLYSTQNPLPEMSPFSVDRKP